MAKIYQEAEKFIKSVFHKSTYDGRGKLNVGEIVGDFLVAKNKEEDPYHDPRPGFVHASSIYGCLPGVFHEMMGNVADAKEEFGERRMAGVFKAGHMFEDFIVDSLGERVLERQREYLYKYKSLTLVGHSDYRVEDAGIMRIGENKSVHSEAFWYRQQEGTLVAWHNQIQLQVYLWLERVLFNNQWEGIFSYISKDDCTIESIPVKYNPAIIDEVVIPILDLLNDAYEKALPLVESRAKVQSLLVGADEEATKVFNQQIAAFTEEIKKIGNTLPLPAGAAYNESRSQYQVNWLCKYCDHHNTCAGAGWLLEAQAEVKRLNSEHKASVVRSVGGTPKPTKPVVGIKAD